MCSFIQRKKSTPNISVKVDVGADYQKPKKITYKVNQEYIKEKYGFFAHSTYIAEVKRECGLDVHEPYNAVEKPVREYHCTEERKKQIREALRHFGEIESLFEVKSFMMEH